MAARRTRTARTTAITAAARERWRQALELRKAGKSYRAIAEALGYGDGGAAYKAVQTALGEIAEEPAKDVRRLELERLDGLYERALSIADEAEDDRARVTAIATAVKVQERRARYLGLDAPVKVQEVPPGKLDDEQLASELEQAANELRARKGAA